LKMFEKVEVPVLGVIENMAVHICSHCGHAEHIFGEGGGGKMASQYEVPLLGSLPLQLSIREQADGGRPTVVNAPESATALIYRDIARKVAARLALQAKNKSIGFPNIVIQNT
jgi:ATP-binding protein involved in chromosome partitioning